MLKLEIIFDDTMLKEILMIFKQSSVQYYTLLEDIKGMGSSGGKFGTAAGPGRNNIAIVVVTDSQKEALTRSIRKLKEICPNAGIKVIISKVDEFI